MHGCFILLMFFSHSDLSYFFNFILRKLVTSNHLLITFVSLFLYVTNYFIYWYPSLAMAENLTLFLFMGGIYLLMLPATRKNVILASVISIAFYITKYAGIPLTGFYFLSYCLKIVVESSSHPDRSGGISRIKDSSANARNDKLIHVILLFVVAFGLFLLYSLWEWQTKGSTLLITLLNVFYLTNHRLSLVQALGFRYNTFPLICLNI